MSLTKDELKEIVSNFNRIADRNKNINKSGISKMQIVILVAVIVLAVGFYYYKTSTDKKKSS